MIVDRGMSPAVRHTLRLAKARTGPATANDLPVGRKLRPRVLPGQLDLFGGGQPHGGGNARRRR
jgi:hypothetical protein